MQNLVLVILIIILIAILISPAASGAAKNASLKRLKTAVTGSLTTRPPNTVDNSPASVVYTIQFNGMALTSNSTFHDTIDVDVIFVLGGHVGAKFGDGSQS